MTTAGVLPNGTLNSVSPSPVITWEFPVLAKYRFHSAMVRSFVEAGPSRRTAGNLNGSHPSPYGATAGLGVEIPVGRFHLAPTLRYTRWAPDGLIGFRNTNPNQAELLVGFSGSLGVDGRPLGGRFSLGAIAGVNLTPSLRSVTNTFMLPSGNIMTQYTQPVRGGLVGPAVGFQILKQLSLDAGAIYRPLRYETVTSINGSGHVQTAAAWVRGRFPCSLSINCPLI